MVKKRGRHKSKTLIKKWTNTTVTSTVNLIQVYKSIVFIVASEPAEDVK